MNGDCFEKFRLTDENKAELKKAFSALIDRQFEAFEGAYLDMFKRLPREVAERMTPQEAAGYVDMVVKEAAKRLEESFARLSDKIEEVSKDEKRMSEIRKEFLNSLGYKEADNG